jgi:opine dehydrogenase
VGLRAAVIGAGPIGCATAGHLAQQGVEVGIHDIRPEVIDPIRERGHVRLRVTMQGEAPVAVASTDIAEVLPGAQLIVNCVPGSAHEAVATAAAPHLEDGAVLLIQPGQTLSSIAFLQAARRAGFEGDLTPVETLNTLFTARLSAPGQVDVFATKRIVRFAAFPARRTAEVAALLQPLFAPLVPCTSVLEVSLNNVNAVLHPPVTLFNTGLTDSATPYLFYMEGATPAVVAVAEAVDAERLAIVRAFGLPATSLQEWYEAAYGIREADLYHTLQAMEPYRTIAGPASMDTRLLLEDIPTGVVAYASLAEKVGVEVPVMQALIETCNTIYQTDFRASGRTLERLGIGHLDREGLLAYFAG